MNKLQLFKVFLYVLPFAILLQVYDAVISHDKFHMVLFTLMASFSLIVFRLLSLRLRESGIYD